MVEGESNEDQKPDHTQVDVEASLGEDALEDVPGVLGGRLHQGHDSREQGDRGVFLLRRRDLDAIFGHLHTTTNEGDGDEVWDGEEETDQDDDLVGREVHPRDCGGATVTERAPNTVEDPRANRPAHIHERVEQAKAQGGARAIGEQLDAHAQHRAGDGDADGRGGGRESRERGFGLRRREGACCEVPRGLRARCMRWSRPLGLLASLGYLGPERGPVGERARADLVRLGR